MKKILLLGGNGYIGSHFYNLIKNIAYVTSVDLCLYGTDLKYSSIINYNNIDSTEQYDVIYCLAGHSSVSLCEKSSSISWRNNVDYFHSLCDKLLPSQRLIYASSASVYGNSLGISTESAPINSSPLTHYDLQKITIDLIADKFITDNKNIVGLRFGTVNGKSPNTRSDLMINAMTKSMVETNKIYVKNPSARRAILGINDLSRALLKLMDTNVMPGYYNLSSFNSTVKNIAEAIQSHCTSSEIIFTPDDEKTFSFEMTSEKFQTAAQFQFTDTVDSLLTELISNFDDCNFQNRSDVTPFNNII